jgi:hypothetical protein
MQVPATITLNNGSAAPRPGYSHFNEKKYAMDIPEKLTGKIRLCHKFSFFVNQNMQL